MIRSPSERTWLQLAHFSDGDCLSVEDGQLIVDQTPLFAPAPGILMQSVAQAALRMIQTNSQVIPPDEMQDGLVTLRHVFKRWGSSTQIVQDLLDEIQQRLRSFSPLLQRIPPEILRLIALNDPTNGLFYNLRLASSYCYRQLSVDTLKDSAMAKAAMKGHLKSLFFFTRLLAVSNPRETQNLVDAYFLGATQQSQYHFFRIMKRKKQIPTLLACLPPLQHLTFYCVNRQQCVDLLRLVARCQQAASLRSLTLGWNLVVINETPTIGSIDVLSADGRYYQDLHLENFTHLRSLSLQWRPSGTYGSPLPRSIASFLGSQPLSSLTQLEKLSVMARSALGPFPQPGQLSALRCLTRLKLEGFTDESVGPTLTKLTKIEKLYFDEIDLRQPAIARQIFGMTQLTNLSLDISDIEDPQIFAEGIAKLKKLRKLNLYSQGNPFFQLRWCALLHTFSTHAFRGGQQEPEELYLFLRRQTELQSFKLVFHSGITVEIYEMLLLHPSMRKLDLSFSNWPTPEFIQALHHVAPKSKVEELRVHSSYENPDLFVAISKLASLKKLDIGTKDETVLKVLRALTKLESLRLYNNRCLTNKGLAFIQDLPSLKTLEIAGYSVAFRNAQCLLTNPQMESCMMMVQPPTWIDKMNPLTVPLTEDQKNFCSYDNKKNSFNDYS